jgi:hypothetical protein
MHPHTRSTQVAFQIEVALWQKYQRGWGDSVVEIEVRNAVVEDAF